MLYRENEEYKLMPFVATYEQNGEKHTQHVIDKEELRHFEGLGHIKNLSFEDAVYEDGVTERLKEVKGYPEREFHSVHEYVLNNNVVPNTLLAANIEKKRLEESILDISSIVLGGMM